MFRVYFYLLKDIIKLYKNKKKVYFMENIQFEVRLVHKKSSWFNRNGKFINSIR